MEQSMLTRPCGQKPGEPLYNGYMESETLFICVSDVVYFGSDFTAPGAVNGSVLSPFFTPDFMLTMSDGGEGCSGSPRGPTVLIDFDFIPSGF